MPRLKTLGDVVDAGRDDIAIDHTLPAPHYAVRQRLRFPQMFSTPEAAKNLPRPFAKNQGPKGQLYYAANFPGGPRHTSTQLTFVSGLGRAALGGAPGLAATSGDGFTRVPVWLQALSAVSAAASGFHGWRRTRSYGWTAVWTLMGAVFPIITPAVAVAQGFGKRE